MSAATAFGFTQSKPVADEAERFRIGIVRDLLAMRREGILAVVYCDANRLRIQFWGEDEHPRSIGWDRAAKIVQAWHASRAAVRRAA